MEQDDGMSSITSQAENISKTGHQIQLTTPTTTSITQMDTVTVEEPRVASNIGSSTVGAQQLSAGDLEALANFQEELDRMAQAPTQSENQEEEQGVVGVQEGVTGKFNLSTFFRVCFIHKIILETNNQI